MNELSFYSSPRLENLGKRIAPDLNIRLSVSYDSFDSEVMTLISDLSLVLKGSVEYLAWQTALENSVYRRYPFCARYHDYQKELHRRCEDLYKRNKKYSRFDYPDELCVQTQFKYSE